MKRVTPFRYLRSIYIHPKSMRRLLLLICCSLWLSTLAQSPKKKPIQVAPVISKPLPSATKPIQQASSEKEKPSNREGEKMTSSDILPYPIYQKRMANGLNVVTVPYPSPGVAAFYIIVRVGSRDEIEIGKSGFAHFFEHMMFRGTKRFPKEAYSAALKSTGASANANTSLDRTVYHMTADASKLDLLFDLEADRFMNLDYSEQDFRTEAGAVKGEYTKNSSNPYTKLNELIQNAAFDQHTYKHTTMGFLKDIIDMPNQFAYSRNFFSRFYRPEYTTILVVGDVKPGAVEGLANKYFGRWEMGNYKSPVPQEPAQSGVRFAHMKKPGFPPYLSLNYRGPAYSDNSKDLAALNILGAVLFSENSTLYEDLVMKDQTVRSLDAGIYPTRDPFLFSVEASLVADSSMILIQNRLLEALGQAKVKALESKKIDQARENIRNSFAMSIDNPTSIAEALSSAIWLTGDPESLNRQYRQYEQITADDIQRVANQYCTEDRLTIGTISSAENSPFKKP